MSNPALEALLKFYADQGLTAEMLGTLTNEEFAELPGPDGEPLNKMQIMVLRANSRRPSIDVRPPSAATGTRTKVLLEEREAEIERLKKIAATKVSVVEERDRLKVAAHAAAEKRKVRISEIVTYTRHMTTVSAAEVHRMVSELSSLGSNLDICFCIDATGSMSGCINNVKQCIVKVATNISASTGMSARFGLVVYRDYCDGGNRHQVWDFGISAAIQSHLATVAATGGGDGPEDCFGGIWAAITRTTWRAPAKVIVWMGDAPQHGDQYTGGGGDDYPAGDPDGRTAAGIFSELQSRHITLVFCKLTNYTDVMCARLRTEVAPFGSGLFLEYSVGADMAAFLTTTIHTTTMHTTAHGASAKGTEKPYTLTPATWTMDGKWGPEEEAEVLTFSGYRGGDLHPLLDLLIDGPDTKSRRVTCRMTLNPVERGEMRYAFYCKITEHESWWRKTEKKSVAKESRYAGSHNTRKALIDQAHIQTVAAFLATDFSMKLERARGGKKLIYVPVDLLRITSRAADKSHYSLEPFIPGDYKKFNNNNGFVDKVLEASHPVLQTFSHFTYSYSRGMVMVVDLQGVVEGHTYKLTDPAIHTADPKKCLKDPTNLGPAGMSAFFATHVCNDLCRRLELKRPEEIDGMKPMEIGEAEEEDKSDAEEVYEAF